VRFVPKAINKRKEGDTNKPELSLSAYRSRLFRSAYAERKKSIFERFDVKILIMLNPVIIQLYVMKLSTILELG
jgi:hypothetical protein